MPGQILRLDDVVEVQTCRPDGAGIVSFYGIVDRVRTLYEGTQFDTDTFLVKNGSLPVNVSYAGHIQVTRIEPEEYLPPQPGDPVLLATDEELKRALYFEGMEKRSLLVTERQKLEKFIKQKTEKKTLLDALELNLERAKIYEQHRKQYQAELTKAAKITSQRLQNRDESGRRLADAET